MDKEKIEDMANEYENELEKLEEIRAENAARYEGLSDDEFVRQLAADYEAIYKDAIDEDINIDIVMPDEEE
ncbi:MAG: hypothetical protein E7341_01970 [Clostridiales bacterium]|nr:hypothetical protein [Clostridiales bacterium]